MTHKVNMLCTTIIYCGVSIMAFRADEAARVAFEEALRYLIPRDLGVSQAERAQLKEKLLDLCDELGPVVQAYPSWHPLVRNYTDDRSPTTTPNERCGYRGLDHTVYFANGFITCPYRLPEDVIESVQELPWHSVADITAERLDLNFYSVNAMPVVVRCKWNKRMGNDGLIPLAIALPLLLEKELPCWTHSEVAETWESMRPYFLGSPFGSRSSLFVSQETGQTIKKIWNALIYTGMYGPIKV